MRKYKNPKVILTRGAAMLQRYGWTQGTYGPSEHPETGAHCAMGVLYALTLDSTGPGIAWPGFDEAERALLQAIKAREEMSYGIIEWNDRPGRTEEQVLRLFAEAAALL